MTILEKLKTETAPQHAKLDTSELLQLLTSPGITPEKYARILQKFYGYFHPIEKQLGSFSSEIIAHVPDFESRRKADLLLKDLQVISDSGISFSAPFATDIPEVKNVAQALGCLYVLEGSTLGGKVISKHLKDNLNLTAENGAAFFNGYGPATGERWSIFRKALLNFADQSPADETEIVDSANNTFLKLSTWLNRTNE